MYPVENIYCVFYLRNTFSKDKITCLGNKTGRRRVRFVLLIRNSTISWKGFMDLWKNVEFWVSQKEYWFQHRNGIWKGCVFPAWIGGLWLPPGKTQARSVVASSEGAAFYISCACGLYSAHHFCFKTIFLLCEE